MWSPVPWYFEYFQAADRTNCAPWELLDEWTPREFWKDAALIVAGAESDHAAFTQQRDAKKQASAPKPSVVGRAIKRLRG